MLLSLLQCFFHYTEQARMACTTANSKLYRKHTNVFLYFGIVFFQILYRKHTNVTGQNEVEAKNVIGQEALI